MISRKALIEYRDIYTKLHGHTPADDILIAEATKLLTLVNTVYKPIKKAWVSEQQKEYDKPNSGVYGPETTMQNKGMPSHKTY
jgi:hypothetical protein